MNDTTPQFCQYCSCDRVDHDANECPRCGHTNEVRYYFKEYEPKELSALFPIRKVTPPTSRAERKDTPVYSGFMKYFPLAIVAVSQLSKSANEVHNPGQPLHWSKGKSNDHRDCLGRHMLELDDYDVEADHDYHYLHAVKAFWRAGAILQEILETGKPARIKKGEL